MARDIPRMFVERLGGHGRTQTSAAAAQGLCTAVTLPHIAMARPCSLRCCAATCLFFSSGGITTTFPSLLLN